MMRPANSKAQEFAVEAIRAQLERTKISEEERKTKTLTGASPPRRHHSAPLQTMFSMKIDFENDWSIANEPTLNPRLSKSLTDSLISSGLSASSDAVDISLVSLEA